MKYTVTTEDLPDHQKGLEIISLLNLPIIRSGPEKGRVRTEWGTKTPAGLYRTLRTHIFTTPNPPA